MIKSPVKSVVRNASPFLTGLLRSVSRLAFDFRDLVGLEKAGGNANVFYNPQDLTSLYVGRDGSGGHPTVGDPVGMMLDTSGLSTSMEDHLAGQPDELGPDWTLNSGWSYNTETGRLTFSTFTSNSNATNDLFFANRVDDQWYLITFDYNVTSNIYLRFGNFQEELVGSGTYTQIKQYNISSVGLFHVNNVAAEGGYIENISIKAIPGNHAIAPSDAARPTLMDDPDTTWASLTDDGTRGEELSDGVVDATAGAATINGTEVTFAGQYANARDVVGIEIGSTVQIQITVKALSGNTNLHFLHENSKVVGGASDFTPISVTGDYQTFTLLVQPNLPTINVGLQDRNVSGFGVCDIQSISVRKVNTAFDERGPELITNGGFDTDSDWTLSTGATIVEGAGVLTDAVYGRGFSQTFQGTIGATYEVSYEVSELLNNNAGVSLDIAGLTDLINNDKTEGKKSVRFISGQSTITIKVRAGSGSANTTAKIDNISVREIKAPNLLLGSPSNSIYHDDDSTFDTDTGNWATHPDVNISGGRLNWSNSGQSNITASYAVGFTVGKWYKVSFYVSSYTSGTFFVRQPFISSPATTVGWHTFYGRADQTQLQLRGDGSPVGSLDNVIVQEVPASVPRSYYLDTDGTDDWMQVTPTLNLGEQWWHTGAWQADAAGTAAFCTTNDFRGRLFALSGGQGWNYRTASDGNAEIVDGDIYQKHVVTVEKTDTNSINGRYNGGPATIITPYDTSAQTQGLALFTQYNLGASIPLNGRFYGGAWGQGQVNYDNLDTIQKYLGAVIDIEPTPVTPYSDVYDMLGAQTAALFNIQDTSSLRVSRNGSDIPVDGDPVGMMLDVSGTGGDDMSTYLENAPELVTNGTFDTDISGWTLGGTAGAGDSIQWNSGVLEVTRTTNNISAYQAISTTIGSVYKVVLGDVSDSFSRLSIGTSTAIPTDQLIGAGELIFVATATTHYVHLRSAAIATQTFDNISVKELPGYVATAPSDAARPTLLSVLDTDASELTDDGTLGPELLYNGDFSDGSTGWTLHSSASIVDGTLSFDGTNTGPAACSSQYFPTIPGEIYEISFDYTVTAGRIRTNNTNLGITGFLLATSSGRYTQRLQANSVSSAVGCQAFNAGTVATFDNISVRKVQTVFDGLGDELVTNGTFDTDSDWTKGTEWTISGGIASVDSTASNQELQQDIGAGNTYYEVTLDVISTNGTGVLEVYHINLGGNAFFDISTTGTKTVRLFGGTHPSSGKVSIRGRGGFVGSIDNVSVKEVLTPNLLLTSAGDDNSTFDTAGDWTLESGITVSSGRLNWTNAGVATASVPVAFEAGKHYKVQFYVHSQTNNGIFSQEPFDIPITRLPGWHTYYGQAVTNSNELRLTSNTTDTTISIDNIIVQEVPASVARNYYLDFDGSDDSLILDGTDFGSSTNATLYKTFRGDSTDTQQIMFGTNVGPWVLEANAGYTLTSIDGNVGSPVYREDGTIVNYATLNAVYGALVDNTDHTIGAEEVNLTATPWTSSGFYIGGEYNTTYNSTGRLYSWAAVDTRLDGRNRDLLENFMLNRKPAPTFGMLSRFGAPILTRDGSTIIPRS